MTDALSQRPAHLWKPGQSGNPRGGPGRTKGLERMMREAFKEDWTKFTDVLRDIAMGRLPAGMSGEVTIKVRDRIEALKLIYDRSFGKAKINVDLTADISQNGLGSVDPDAIEDEALFLLRDTILTALDPRKRVIDAKSATPVVVAPKPDARAAIIAAAVAEHEQALAFAPVSVEPEPEQELAPVSVVSEPATPAPRNVIEHVFKGSSNVMKATLDLDTKMVDVAFFGGARYRYANFTRELLDQWKIAVSAGAWLNDNVKKCADKHPLVRIK